MDERIALSSTGPLSGKTTLANYLHEHYGFIHVSHAQTLIEDFVRHENRYSRRLLPLTVEEVLTNKEYWRPYLQEYGVYIGFHDPTKARSWVDKTLTPWYETGKKDPVVFEPVRSEEQAEVLKEYGFTIVQLEIPEFIREYRASKLGKDYGLIRMSMDRRPEVEGGLKNPDIRIFTEVPVDQLARMILYPQEYLDECCARDEVEVGRD